jgi:GMP synthase (glutamine-hydrolysing)
MSVLVFSHSDAETGGTLLAALRAAGQTVDVRRADLHGRDPLRGVPFDRCGVDAVVMLGGPAYVTDIERLPWMRSLAEFLHEVHHAGVPLAGICLGAQLIAQVLGGEVGWKARPAVGMHELTNHAASDPFFDGQPETQPHFFSCSQEVVRLPADATLLGSTSGTRHAVYRVGSRTIAMQSHPECDESMVRMYVAEDHDLVERAGFTHDSLAENLRRHLPAYLRCGERIASNLVSHLLSPR